MKKYYTLIAIYCLLLPVFSQQSPSVQVGIMAGKGPNNNIQNTENLALATDHTKQGGFGLEVISEYELSEQHALRYGLSHRVFYDYFNNDQGYTNDLLMTPNWTTSVPLTYQFSMPVNNNTMTLFAGPSVNMLYSLNRPRWVYSEKNTRNHSITFQARDKGPIVQVGANAGINYLFHLHSVGQFYLGTDAHLSFQEPWETDYTYINYEHGSVLEKIDQLDRRSSLFSLKIGYVF